jgi:UPF0716 protein FxsA
MWLILAVLALPLVEIALFVVIGGAIGLWATLAWVVLSAVMGVFVLKRVARMGPISFDRDVKALRDPMSPIAGRALTILGAGLLILPGFFTDTLGLLLLLPPVQALLVNMLSRRLRQSGDVHQASMTIEGDWAEVSPARNDDQGGPNSAQHPSGWTRH